MLISDLSSDVCSSELSWYRSSASLRGLLHAGVVLEGLGRGELAELVADHGLGDVHGHVLATVVDSDGVTHHVGDDRGPAGPRLDDLLLALLVERVDLLQEVVVDEGALLEGTGHARLLSPRAAGTAAAHDHVGGLLLLVAGPALGLAPGRDRVATTGGLALAATVGVVAGVPTDAAGLGADDLPAVAAGLAEIGRAHV